MEADRKKMMPPTRLVRYCCEHLKERGGSGRRVVTGVRWAESQRRRKRDFVEECFKDKHRIYVHPIIDWTSEDVWEYIKINKIKYCSLYGEGFKRLGCIGCSMAGTNIRKQEFKRWPKYEILYKRAFAKIAITGTDANRKLHWKNGEDVFSWWMEEDKHTKQDEDQTVMFE